jgi:hypothetical protein
LSEELLHNSANAPLLHRSISFFPVHLGINKIFSDSTVDNNTGLQTQEEFLHLHVVQVGPFRQIFDVLQGHILNLVGHLDKLGFPEASVKSLTLILQSWVVVVLGQDTLRHQWVEKQRREEMLVQVSILGLVELL